MNSEYKLLYINENNTITVVNNKLNINPVKKEYFKDFLYIFNNIFYSFFYNIHFYYNKKSSSKSFLFFDFNYAVNLALIDLFGFFLS